MAEQVPANEQTIIDAGQRVKNFVQDEAVQAVIARMASQYYSDFKAAKTPDELLRASHKSSVLDDFVNELQVPIDRGAVAKMDKTRREERDQKAEKVH